MVVDIRYHLASLVAVFFALGLGILVGMSIASAENGNELQKQWMAAIENQLEALRHERRELESRLEAVSAERDLYREFAEDAVAALIDGRLAGERAAVVAVGPPTGAAERILDALTRAGARAGSLTAGESQGFLPVLASELAGSDPPRRVVAVLSGSPGEHRHEFEALLEAAGGAGVQVAAVVDGRPEWRRILDDRAISYVTHVHSPPGALSLVLLLASGEPGRYGGEGGLPGWPKHLLAPGGAASVAREGT